MCLAIPGLLLSIEGVEPAESCVLEQGEPAAWINRTGQVKFGGVTKEVNLAYVPEAKVGDYVIVHVGFAIGTLDEAEAGRVFEYLREMDELQELDAHSGGPR